VPVQRDDPYRNFNFLVTWKDSPEGTSVLGGFSEVSGLGVEVGYVEYRNGNDKWLTPRKLPGLRHATDVTLKRGLIGAANLFNWIKTVGEGGGQPELVTITLMDEERQPVTVWNLVDALPKKWTGPVLVAKGGGVAIEELVLVCRDLEMP